MAMTPRNRRVVMILLAVLAAGVVMCLVCGTIGAFQSRQWFDRMLEEGQRTMAEADTFGAGHDQQACLEEGLHRSDACEPTGMGCFTQVSVFLDRCFDVSAPTPNFCDGVPPQTEIMQGVTWARETCTRLGRLRDAHCPQIVQSVQRACARHTPR